MTWKRPRTTVLVVLTMLAGFLGIVTGAAVNVATAQPGPWPGQLEWVRTHALLLATVLGGTAVIASAVVVWWQERRLTRNDDPPAPQLEPPPDWIIGRPAEVEEVVRLLRRRRLAGPVGLTTGVRGAGGFGKTTLATVVCADKRIRRQFRGRIYWVTLGRDIVGGADLAARVNSLCTLITGLPSEFDNPELAGWHLGRVLDDRPGLLIVIDDAWHPDHLKPFLVAGAECERLVTTRVSSALPSASKSVVVDVMTSTQAEAVLRWQLPGLPDPLVDDLLATTGRWPLLLRLTNRSIADLVETGMETTAAAEAILKKLHEGGPAALDDSTTTASAGLDSPHIRARMVRATVEASATLLPQGGRERLLELGVFAEDEEIPIELVARMWQETGDLDETESRGLCYRMAQLALINLSPRNGGQLSLHDVVRDYLRAEFNTDQELQNTNRALIRGVERSLPSAPPFTKKKKRNGAAWWQLDEKNRYLWDHAIEHFTEAGELKAAEATATDIRWILARLVRSGVTAPISDLGRVPTRTASLLAPGLRDVARIVDVADPPHMIIDSACARLASDPAWRNQIEAFQASLSRPHLTPVWPLSSTAARVAGTLAGPVRGVAIAPSRSWLATAGPGTSVHMWDIATRSHLATLVGHTGRTSGVAVAADGTWLVTTSYDCTARIWDVATGTHRATLTGHTSPVTGAAIAPDGTWLVTTSADATARIWDVTTEAELATLSEHGGPVNGAAISPDGTWLATTSTDATVQVWNMINQTPTRATTLTGHAGPVYAAAVAPNGSWLATVGNDNTVRMWCSKRWTERAGLRLDGPGLSAAWAPNDDTLAVGDDSRVYLLSLRADRNDRN